MTITAASFLDWVGSIPIDRLNKRLRRGKWSTLERHGLDKFVSANCHKELETVWVMLCFDQTMHKSQAVKHIQLIRMTAAWLKKKIRRFESGAILITQDGQEVSNHKRNKLVVFFQ